MTFEEAFIKTIRTKFQTSDGRIDTIGLMVKEIRLGEMKKRNEMVSMEEAISIFTNEVKDSINILACEKTDE